MHIATSIGRDGRPLRYSLFDVRAAYTPLAIRYFKSNAVSVVDCGIALRFSTTINYIDRQTLSALEPYLRREFAWTNSDFALIVIAFRAAYTIFQAVSGRLLDKLGTRRGLSLAVLWYSIAAFATSMAAGLRSFAILRFLLGAGEAAKWPGAAKAVAEWFPESERGLAVAIFDSGSAVGGAIAPVLVIWLYTAVLQLWCIQCW